MKVPCWRMVELIPPRAPRHSLNVVLWFDTAQFQKGGAGNAQMAGPRDFSIGARVWLLCFGIIHLLNRYQPWLSPVWDGARFSSGRHWRGRERGGTWGEELVVNPRLLDKNLESLDRVSMDDVISKRKWESFHANEGQ